MITISLSVDDPRADFRPADRLQKFGYARYAGRLIPAIRYRNPAPWLAQRPNAIVSADGAASVPLARQKKQKLDDA
jgi:hypothetical protein